MPGIIGSLLLTYLRRFPFDQGKAVVKRMFFRDAYGSGETDYTNSLGNTFRLNLGDHVQREMFFHDIFEKNTFRNISRMVKEDFVMLDCGAHIGAYSINLARQMPRGKVYAFEPHPETFRLLNENVKLNGLTNIVTLPLGLSDKEEDVMLYAPFLTTASVYKHQDSDKKFPIHLTTIDSFCAQNGIGKVDLIKIDIEGGEWKCIEGAKETLARNPDIILQVEVDKNCESAGYSRQQLFAHITGLGFTAWKPRGFPLSMTRMESVPGDYKDNIIFTRGYSTPKA